MPSTNTHARFLLLAALVAILSAAAGFGLWQWRSAAEAPALGALKALPEPRVLADFRLLDQDGREFSLDRLRGQWSLLFFGFTHCPDVCPSALYDLQQVRRTLAEQSPGAMLPQIVFVSVDPERDTPARMKEYVAFFDPAFIGLTGAPEQLAPLALQMGVAYRVEPHEAGAPTYQVDHSASIFLTNPDGRLHGIFPAPQDAALMAGDVATLALKGH